MPGDREPSLRLIERVDDRQNTRSHIIAIRTSQNGAVALTRDKTDAFWLGTSRAEFIVVASIDDLKSPSLAILQLFDAAHMNSVFSREYAKERKKKRSFKRKHTTGFFLPSHAFKPLTHPKYFGPSGILPHSWEPVELSKYMQLGPGDLRSSVKELLASRSPSRPDYEAALARSLGINRKKVAISILKNNGNAAPSDAPSIEAPRAGSNLLFSDLSPKARRETLVRTVEDHLERGGHKVEKDPEARGRNTRRLTQTNKGRTQTAHISIRTSQNGKIGYKRDRSGRDWEGLQDVQFVAISCLDNPKMPRFADIHYFKVETLKNALFSALHSREKAGIVVKPGDTVWLPLYEQSSRNDPMYAGGGLACIRMIQPFDDRPPMLERKRVLIDLREYVLLSDNGVSVPYGDKELITYAEAKKLTALLNNVRESQVHIKIDDGPTKRSRSKSRPERN